ncbi:MAG: hypothetical protein CL908_13895 [Deltaproteobacteria bacterium]|nr:hypothetical protein [Deltaproteobacteria bacterium]
MSVFPHRLFVAVLSVAVASAACGQGGSCTQSVVPVPLQPVYSAPTLPTIETYVDPSRGDDALAMVGGVVAYQTIQAAVDAVAASISLPGQMGCVVLLPGRYGYKPTEPRYNGEVWPVQVPPGVRIEGVNALNVIIDGGAKSPSSTTTAVPSPMQSGFVNATPAFVYGGASLFGYSHTLLNRVTFVDADVGVLITGGGEVDPTIAECLFMNCTVGAQVHSTGTLTEGVHKPKFLWCTFGNCDFGVAVTGETAGIANAPRSYPAIVNSLFKCDHDLDGVGCDAVLSSAFASTRTNTSAFVLQPALAPTPLFDVEGYSRDDLFIGARYRAPTVLPADQWFTDWRLTHRTEGPPIIGNPAATAGITVFPAITPNGTPTDIIVGDVTLGTESGEGGGTYGPLSNPYGGSTGHIGYRSGGTFLVGGTVPGERKFGLGMNGVMYNQLELFWQPGSALIGLLGVAPTSPTLWRPGQRQADGVQVPGTPLGTIGPALGNLFLDFPSLPITDWSILIPVGGSTTGTHLIPLGNLTPSGLEVLCVWQAAYIDPLGSVVGSDAQPFTIRY